MLETALMGLIGLFLGALIGGAVTAWLGVHGFTMPGMDELGAKFNLPSRLHPDVTIASLLSGPLVVFLFSLLASVYPALRLRRQQPVEAMRSALRKRCPKRSFSPGANSGANKAENR